MVKTLSKCLVNDFETHFVPGNAHIRCLAHIVNLTVQQILSSISEAESPNSTDYFDKSLPVHYSPETDEVLAEMENEDQDDDEMDAAQMEEIEEADSLFMQILTAGKDSLSPLKKVVFRCSPMKANTDFILDSFGRLLQRLYLHHRDGTDSDKLQRRSTKTSEQKPEP